jgi:hypothetical protein
MKKIHAKSPCCGAKIIRFGERRKQCTQCHKTWRKRKKKRGRKQKRVSKTIVEKYFSNTLPSFYGKAKERGAKTDSDEYRLQKSRDLFLRTTDYPDFPENGPLILIADAKRKKICGKMTTVYIILVRAVSETTAVVHRPHVEEGTESVAGWDRAFDTLPESVKNRVLALVCDGHRGLVYSSKWRGWKLQRCHFHLLKSLIVRRSARSTRGYAAIGTKILSLARMILITKDEDLLTRSISEIEAIGWETKSGSLRAIVSGFLNHLDEYRTYLLFPELRLPRTSNSGESFISGLQKVFSRAHGFSTKKSFILWTECYVKWRRKIACNPS